MFSCNTLYETGDSEENWYVVSE